MTTSNAFQPREHLITIKNRQGGGSEYLPVQFRLLWFRTDFPEGSIETEVVIIDLDRVVEAEQFVWNAEKRRNEKVVKTGKGFACFKATVRTGQGGSASATGSESAVDFGEFIEKAETKAIGRALAGLGFGTQFAPELNEGQRIVDAPVGQKQDDASSLQFVPKQGDPNGAVTTEQREQIRKLCEVLEMSVPDGTATNGDAKALIQRLTAEYRAKQSRQPQAPNEQVAQSAITNEPPTVHDIRTAYQDAYPRGIWETFVANNIGGRPDSEITIEQRAALSKKLETMLAASKPRVAQTR